MFASDSQRDGIQSPVPIVQGLEMAGSSLPWDYGITFAKGFSFPGMGVEWGWAAEPVTGAVRK